MEDNFIGTAEPLFIKRSKSNTAEDLEVKYKQLQERNRRKTFQPQKKNYQSEEGQNVKNKLHPSGAKIIGEVDESAEDNDI